MENKHNSTLERPIQNIHLDESGSMTILGLVFFVCVAITGGFALDVANLYAARTHLQIAADQGAHAAIYNRPLMDANDAKQRAMDIVQATLPSAKYGAATTTQNIEFGRFDTEDRTFVVDESATEAVRVVTSFSDERDNAVKSYLFKLIGFDEFDVTTQSIFTSYHPGCLRQGFIAEGIVDIQSNNAYSSGFCVHSNTYVSLNSNNTFEPGTIVSMPDLADLDLPRSGFKTNDGLSAALRQSSLNIRILSRIDNMIYRYENPLATDYPRDTEELPNYIVDPIVQQIRTRKVETADLEAGHVYSIVCTGGSGLTIDASETLRNVVIISPCEIKFSAGSSIEDVRIISKSTSSDSINAPSGLRVGFNDACSPGGGAQLITTGGMRFPADLQLFGAQLLAKGDISFAANANGLQGASLIAGGEISGTSNMNMGLCPDGMEDNIEIPYFRLGG